MKTKHTPGPWTFDGVGSHFSVFVRDYQEDDNGDICQVNEPQNYPDEEAKANAQLIAAAPEMLEELEHALSGLRILSGSMPDHKGLKQDIARVEKVIQKATE